MLFVVLLYLFCPLAEQLPAGIAGSISSHYPASFGSTSVATNILVKEIDGPDTVDMEWDLHA